jgi:GMP synthase-like glutamine amidotransferase
MKPIAVFQHTEVGAPGTVISVLEALGHEVRVVRIVDGEAVPDNASAFSGLVFMGGYMSAHDPLPWIARELALIREADAHDIPVAGHCLGSQLVALALGGTVRRDRQPEMGWSEIETPRGPVAREWWGDEYADRSLQTFQWHGDTFDPPAANAVQIASGRYCSSQAFVLRGLHLLVQSHLEMTPELVTLSAERNGHQLLRQNENGNPAASPHDDLLRELPERTQRMQHLLLRLYGRWTQRCG